MLCHTVSGEVSWQAPVMQVLRPSRGVWAEHIDKMDVQRQCVRLFDVQVMALGCHLVPHGLHPAFKHRWSVVLVGRDPGKRHTRLFMIHICTTQLALTGVVWNVQEEEEEGEGEGSGI